MYASIHTGCTRDRGRRRRSATRWEARQRLCSPSCDLQAERSVRYALQRPHPHHITRRRYPASTACTAAPGCLIRWPASHISEPGEVASVRPLDLIRALPCVSQAYQPGSAVPMYSGKGSAVPSYSAHPMGGTMTVGNSVCSFLFNVLVRVCHDCWGASLQSAAQCARWPCRSEKPLSRVWSVLHRTPFLISCAAPCIRSTSCRRALRLCLRASDTPA